MAVTKSPARLPGAATSTGATRLWLPCPEALPSWRSELTVAVRTLFSPGGVLAAFGDPGARAELRARLTARQPDPGPCTPPHGPAKQPGGPSHTRRLSGHQAEAETPGGQSHGRRPLSLQAQAEQEEHDRYFEVGRTAGDAAQGFAAGSMLAYLSAYENCLSMGVTLLDDQEWGQLFAGLAMLLRIADGNTVPLQRPDGQAVVRAGDGAVTQTPGYAALPARPEPAGWRDAYDPAERWLVGHQLFFALIQGAVVGLNCFTRAAADLAIPEADEGLALAAAFLRSSAAAMKFASDFAPDDYETTVRPAMAPPKVREGFSGLQTRDHTYLVRVFGAVKPALAALAGQSGAHREFVESVISAYGAHEFICARFRGNVLPSLRMAAASRGKTGRTGVEVIREMMQARLALIGPGRAGRPATAIGDTATAVAVPSSAAMNGNGRLG